MQHFPEIDDKFLYRGPHPALRWVMRLFPWAFVGAGLLALFLTVPSAWNGWQSRRWPSIPGTVRTSHYVSVNEAAQQTRRDEPIQTRVVDHLVFDYEYLVDGQTYHGSRVAYSAHESSEPKRGSVFTLYPVGQAVTVHYDPDQPQKAVLEPGFFWSVLIGPALGLLFAVAGAAMVRPLWNAAR